MPRERQPTELRILFCLLYYLPHRTGLTLYVRQLAEAMAARGHQVTILCARHARDTPAGPSIENGVRVVRLRPLPFPISRGMLLPGYPLALWRLLRAAGVASVHTPLFEAPLIALCARLLGRRVVITHHGDLVLPAGIVNRFITAVMLGGYRLLARNSSALVGHTRDYAEVSTYLSPYLDKVEVVVPPVEVPRPDPARVAALRREWSPDGGPIVGFAGRFVEEKRPDLLIRALEVINQTYPNARIVFAGQHLIPYESFWERQRELVERYAPQLTFLGVVPSVQEMANFYAACDVLALTSDTECFALVQVEAMLCGTPVVMTDTPGGRVPVRLTGMGKLAPMGDARAIGEALVEVIRDRESFVKPAEEIQRLFAPARAMDAYEELFRRHARPSLPQPQEKGRTS
jgi:glycosyltransferase involved in cell wall biosynthesis